MPHPATRGPSRLGSALPARMGGLLRLPRPGRRRLQRGPLRRGGSIAQRHDRRGRGCLFSHYIAGSFSLFVFPSYIGCCFPLLHRGRVFLNDFLREGRARVPESCPREVAELTAFFANFCKNLTGSFSAVPKRNFASKYVFDRF